MEKSREKVERFVFSFEAEDEKSAVARASELLFALLGCKTLEVENP